MPFFEFSQRSNVSSIIILTIQNIEKRHVKEVSIPGRTAPRLFLSAELPLINFPSLTILFCALLYTWKRICFVIDTVLFQHHWSLDVSTRVPFWPTDVLWKSKNRFPASDLAEFSGILRILFVIFLSFLSAKIPWTGNAASKRVKMICTEEDFPFDGKLNVLLLGIFFLKTRTLSSMKFSIHSSSLNFTGKKSLGSLEVWRFGSI